MVKLGQKNGLIVNLKQKIMSKAEDLLESHYKKIKDFKNSLKAGICPTCEKVLKIKTIKHEYKKQIGWLFKKTVKRNFKDYKVVCPDNHPIIDPRDNSDRSNICCYEWGHTINFEILKCHNDNTEDWYDDSE